MQPLELPIITLPADGLPAARTARAGRGRISLPRWLRTSLPTGPALERFQRTQAAISGNVLHTVCEEAHCPNIHNCWGRGTATFMVAGKDCTRGCRFCAVETAKRPAPLDPAEPEHLASAVAAMNLAHAVVTVVNRDDLADGGASHYRACVLAVHRRRPQTAIELLCSDLAGNLHALESLLHELPLAVFAHNVECVPRLDGGVRDPRASFAQSLAILRHAKAVRPDLVTKSSIMVGLGETDAEITDAMRQLRRVRVDLLTIGQYLAPSAHHHPVERFVPPERFQQWTEEARALGFSGVAAGPLVRSSYRAESLFQQAKAAIAGAVIQSQATSDPANRASSRPESARDSYSQAGDQ